MSLQHQRVVELCNELRLGGIAAQYPALAQKAAAQQTSFTDFVEQFAGRRARIAPGAGARDVRTGGRLPGAPLP